MGFYRDQFPPLNIRHPPLLNACAAYQTGKRGAHSVGAFNIAINNFITRVRTYGCTLHQYYAIGRLIATDARFLPTSDAVFVAIKECSTYFLPSKTRSVNTSDNMRTTV